MSLFIFNSLDSSKKHDTFGAIKEATEQDVVMDEDLGVGAFLRTKLNKFKTLNFGIFLGGFNSSNYALTPYISEGQIH